MAPKPRNNKRSISIDLAIEINESFVDDTASGLTANPVYAAPTTIRSAIA